MEPDLEHSSTLQRIAAVFQTGRANDNLSVKIVIGVVLVVLVALMFPHPESIEYNYGLGAIWADKDLIAPFSFPILKDAPQYEKERLEAARSVSPVFDRRDEVSRTEVDSVSVIFRSVKEAATARNRWLRTRSRQDSLQFGQLAARLPFSLSETEWKQLGQSISGERKTIPRLGDLESAVSNTLAEVLRSGVLDRAKVGRTPGFISLRKGNNEDVVVYDKVYDAGEAVRAVAEQCDRVAGDKVLTSVASKIAGAALRPNLVYDSAETNREIQVAEDNVPRTVGYVQENERVIGRHDRITEENKLKLDSYQKARIDRGAELSDWKHTVGIVFHVMLVTGLFGIYLFLFRKRIFHDNAKLTLVALLLLMETLFAYVTSSSNLPDPADYLIFVPAASMLLTIIFDSRVAFYGTVTMALLIGGIKGNDYGIALTCLVAGSLGAYTVRDIRNRTQIFRSLMFIFLGYSISIITLSFERNESVNTVLSSLTYAMANAIFSPVLTYGLLIFFERVFKVTTDLTLLELSDFNQPLLRQLAEKAPGTFHHSMLLGNLAEAGAEAIGANSILARVGAYYHDIGKLIKPEYFVENQVGSVNRHNRLKPRMSARIIAAHVRDGVELGRQYGLPEKIIDFIPQHHGTTVISYFLDKAMNQAAKKNAKESVVEDDFRYPGPKPQSKEAGLVMLADSVEASTRSLTEITPQWLETSIENMIKQRFVEGQLDYCDLTLRDLTRIKEAFLKILLGIHHQRIQYPDQLRTEREISEAASGEKGAVPEGLPGEVLPADQLSPDQLSSDQLAQEHQAGQHRREHLRRHPRRTGQERQAPAAPGLASAMPVPDEGIVSPDQDEPGGEDRDEPRSPESGSSPGHSMPDQSP
jgi:putative nucleotidyltransferase with HDIG domain